MIAGRNELHLNTATMRIIVQEWLDRNVTNAPKVTDFAHSSAGGNLNYVVTTEARPLEDKKP